MVFPQSNGVILDRFLSVQAAAEISGYNVQYLRRMLRAGKLEGIKIGQVWLISLTSFENYIQHAMKTNDKRFGSGRITSGVSESV
jgi:excisionase family DNA binding protein